MLFNSVEFAVFLPIVFFLYWFVFKKLKQQNLLLLVTSYIFYGFWDWRFLFLLAFSTGLDFFTGIKISQANSKKMKTVWLWISIGVNLGFLGFFKYYNFFISSFADLLGGFGLHLNMWSLNVILPVGISFYTFHGLSYVLDIYYDRIKPEKSIVDYSVFVSFFPLLVAGPIERATHLLPQIKIKRIFENSKVVDGTRQILWGLFKKIVIADNCAGIVNEIFSNYSDKSGLVLLLGAFFFAFQIYGDFSGYSDIAIGTGKLFGISLLRNFAFPYFSRDIAEFWRRWHISLSSWFRDYVYIPLGGSRVSKAMQVRNTMIIFVLSGFWHGANWTFIAWGALNALYFMPLLLSNKNRKNIGTVAEGKIFVSFRQMSAIAFTFFLTLIAWIFFRADNLTMALNYIYLMFSGIFTGIESAYPYIFSKIFLLILLFTSVEWIQRNRQHALNFDHISMPVTLRWSVYYLIIAVIFFFGGSQQNFIYFQF